MSRGTTKPIEDRFWSKVDKRGPDECWLWTGARAGPDASAGEGYGHLYGGRRGEGNIRANRLSYILANESIPDDLFVLHKCDNQKCVNPTHLFLGTQKENIEDANRKGRLSRGTSRYNAKLSECDIWNIRIEYAKGDISQRALAKFFAVAQQHISDIVVGNRWKHVVAEP